MVAAALRIPYTLGIATFGGRNWTMFSVVRVARAHRGTIGCWPIPGCRCGPISCARRSPDWAVPTTRRLWPMSTLLPCIGARAWRSGSTPASATSGSQMIQLVGLLVLAIAGHRQPVLGVRAYLVLLTVVAVGRHCYMDNLAHGTEREPPALDPWSSATPMCSRCSTSAPSAPGSASPSRSGRFCRSTSWATGKPKLRLAACRRSSPLSDRCWGPWPGSMAVRLADRIGGSRVTLGVLAGTMGVAPRSWSPSAPTTITRPAHIAPPWSATSADSWPCSSWPGWAMDRCTR